MGGFPSLAPFLICTFIAYGVFYTKARLCGDMIWVCVSTEISCRTVIPNVGGGA